MAKLDRDPIEGDTGWVWSVHAPLEVTYREGKWHYQDAPKDVVDRPSRKRKPGKRSKATTTHAARTHPKD